MKSLHFEGSFNGIEKSDVERGIFTKKAIDSQPLLASYEPDVIGHRSLLLQRYCCLKITIVSSEGQ